jgi:hypothetical protein
VSKSYIAGDVKSVEGRVRFLLREKWSDNQSHMARDVGVAAATLSRVLTGQRPAGRELLLAIGTCKGINLRWVLHGSGEPFATTDQVDLRPWFLPVSEQLLPGPPAGSPDRLTGYYYPVTEPFYRPSRYWLRLSAAHFVDLLPDHCLHTSDLLLLEGDATFWAGDVELRGKLAVVRCQGEDAIRLVRFGRTPKDKTDASEFRNDAFDPSYGSFTRHFRLESSANAGRVPSSEQTESPALAYHTDDEVVAIAVQLVRLWP